MTEDLKLTLNEHQLSEKNNLIIPRWLKQQFWDPDTTTYLHLPCTLGHTFTSKQNE